MHVASADEMARLDDIAVENGLQIRQMMELAGWHMRTLFDRLQIDSTQRVIVVCGVGNKGGDGLCAARHLHNQGFEVRVVLMHTDISTDAMHYLQLLQTMDIPIFVMQEDEQVAEAEIQEADVLIDALIGYRLDGAPRGPFKQAVEMMNSSSAMIVSYDVPTGLEPTDGECLEPCIHADATLSLALLKKAFQTKEGKEVAGSLFLADIGIPQVFYDQLQPNSRPGFDPDGLLEIYS